MGVDNLGKGPAVKIQARIDLQRESFGKEKGLPDTLFRVYDEWGKGLMALKEKYGAVVTPDQLVKATV